MLEKYIASAQWFKEWVWVWACFSVDECCPGWNHSPCSLVWQMAVGPGSWDLSDVWSIPTDGNQVIILPTLSLCNSPFPLWCEISKLRYPFPLVFKLSSLAIFLQKAERKWEEKRQNLEHYNGKEFEKLLEEAQANIMKSIPNLEMPPASGPPPKGDASVDKPEMSGEIGLEQVLQERSSTTLWSGIAHLCWTVGAVTHFLRENI